MAENSLTISKTIQSGRLSSDFFNRAFQKLGFWNFSAKKGPRITRAVESIKIFKPDMTYSFGSDFGFRGFAESMAFVNFA
jgi:hypothetical protein